MDISVDDEEVSRRPLTGTMTRNVAKVQEAIWKIGKQFTMFAALSECRMEHTSEFCQMSWTCATLQQNLCQGCWAVIKGIPHCCLHQAEGTRPKRPQLYLHHHYWWPNLCVWAGPWEKAAVISGEDSNFTVTEESMTNSEHCQINVDIFLWHWRHKEFVPPRHMVNGNFYFDVLRWLRGNIWCKHPDKWRNNSWALHHDKALAHSLLVVMQFLASTKISHPPPSLLTGPWPLWFFPILEDEIEA